MSEAHAQRDNKDSADRDKPIPTLTREDTEIRTAVHVDFVSFVSR